MRPVGLPFCVWLCAGACGRIGFDSERAPIAPTCTALAGAWTLEPSALVPELSSPADDREPFVTSDGLTAYVANLTSSQWQSYQSTRATADADWQPIRPTTWVETAFAQVTRVAITADGLEAFVSATTSTSVTADLWVASRPNRDGAFGAFAKLDTVNTPDSNVDVYPSDDALRIYFVVQTASASRLMVAERPSRSAPFGAALPVPGISDEQADNPAVTPDELMLVYASHPSGPGVLTFAVRASPDEPFGAPQPLPVVNIPGDDNTEADLWGCDSYFAANPAGNLDIYRSQFVPAS